MSLDVQFANKSVLLVWVQVEEKKSNVVGEGSKCKCNMMCNRGLQWLNQFSVHLLWKLIIIRLC